MTNADITTELRDCAQWLETVTTQMANTARTESLDAERVYRAVTAMRDAADRLAAL